METSALPISSTTNELGLPQLPVELHSVEESTRYFQPVSFHLYLT